jgi:hypothetical protein
LEFEALSYGSQSAEAKPQEEEVRTPEEGIEAAYSQIRTKLAEKPIGKLSTKSPKAEPQSEELRIFD